MKKKFSSRAIAVDGLLPNGCKAVALLSKGKVQGPAGTYYRTREIRYTRMKSKKKIMGFLGLS